MKWISTNNSSAGESFELWEDEQRVAAISFNTNNRIARFVSTLSKRLFFFEKKGLLSPKAIIKNEYGIRMGAVEEVKPGRGFVELNENKYSFIYNENNSGQLMLFDEKMQHNLLSCSFNAIASSFSKTKSLLDSKFPSLLLALCWYALQPQNGHLQEVVSFN